MPRYIFSSANLVASCVCGLALAGNAQTLAPVTVSATRTALAPFDAPATVDVIDGERLRSDGRAQLNLSESMSLVPGVLARDRQNQAQDLQLSIRGFGARSTFGVRGVRIYVDGIPATLPDGQGQLSHIDLGSAERIEVLRGPFSALYGNSSGGVVQVFTQQGEGGAVVTPSAAFGSDGFTRAGVQASGSQGPLGYTLGVSQFSSDGYRAHSAASRSLGNARLDWDLQGGGKLTLAASQVRLRADDPLGLTRAQFDASPRSADASALLFNTRKTVQQTQAGLVYEYPLEGGSQLRAMVYLGERATVQYQAVPVAVQGSALHPGGVIDLARSYGGADLRWTHRANVSDYPLVLVAGLAYDTLREHRLGFQNFTGAGTGVNLGVQGALRRDDSNRAVNLDPYAQVDLKLSTRWALNVGIRQSTVRFESTDHYINGANGNDSGNARFSATLPVAGISFAPTLDWRLYAAVGKGFETPTLNEIAYRANGAPGLNFDLRPARSNNVEAGVKWRTPVGQLTRVEWSAAVFQTRTQDEIVSQTNVGGRSTFQNAGATGRRGLELAASLQLPGHWLMALSGTALDARYRDGFASCNASPCAVPNIVVPAGNRIPGVARTALAAELGWRPAKGWRGGVDVRYLSQVFADDRNTAAAAAFTVVGAHVGYVLDAGRWQVGTTVRIDNLTGKKYTGSVIVNEGNGRYFEPAAGRSGLLSVTGRYAF
jgi:iron complex outermembrane receptor protein